MSNPQMMAVLGLNIDNFRAGLTVSEKSLKELDGQVKTSAAAIAVFEQGMKNGGTAEQVKQLDAMRTKHRELGVELKNTTRQMEALRAVQTTTPAAMPAPSRAMATVQRSFESGPAEAPAHGGGGGAGGGGHSNAMQAGHSVRAVFDMMGAGQNLTQALQMELPKLLQASGQGLGAMMGIQLGTTLFKAVSGISQAAAVTREQNASAMTGGGAGSGTRYASENSLSKQADEMRKSREEILDESGNGAAGHNKNVFQWLGRGVKDLFRGGKSTAERDDDKMGALDDKRVSVSGELARRAQENLALDARAHAEGEAAVALDRERLRLREEIGKVMDDTSVDGSARAKIIDTLREESRLREEIIERQKQQRHNEIDEAWQNVGTRQRGDHVESTLAEDKLRRAKADLRAGPQAGEEFDRHRIAVAQAEHEYEQSQHHDRETDSDLTTRKANADLRGSADQKAYARAVNDRDNIQAKLDDPATKPDERRKLEAELAEQKSRVRDLAKASREKTFGVEAEGIKTEQGRGPAERVAAIDKELQLLESRRRHNQEKNGDDPLVEAQLATAAHDLKKEKEDILFAERETLEAARGHTAEMQLQHNGLNLLASIERTRLSYQQQMAVALREGKTELAAQLQLQSTLAVNQQRMQAYFMTPQQRLAQSNQERETAQRNKRFEKDDGLIRIDRGWGDGKNVTGYDPVLRRRRRMGDHSAYDIRQGAENAAKGDAGATWKGENIVTAVQKVESALGGAFKNR